jgi:two-component system, OmpR family, response regulator
MEGTRHRSGEDARAHRVVLAIPLEKKEAAVLAYDAMTHGLQVALFACVEEAHAIEVEPLLAVLGAHEPNVAGVISACMEIGARFANTPMLVLVPGHNARLEKSALAAGAQDVIACPDRILHVLTRLRGLLLRADRDARRDVVTAGSLVVDRKLRSASLQNRALELTMTEFVIVEHLVLQEGRVVPIAELMSALHRTLTHRTIREHIRHIRDKMNPSDPEDSPIRNKHGYGYCVDAGWEPRQAVKAGFRSSRPS